MNYLVAIHFVMANCLLPTNTNVEFEMDFVHSFLVKADKLRKTARLDNAEDRWIKKTGYKDAVGISIENWTNQKLLFPQFTISKGSKDRWYKPVDIEKHTRDIALLAYGPQGSGTKGSLSYQVEDSWPKTFISLGWNTKNAGVEVVLSAADKHKDFEGLLNRELNSLLLKAGMRFYKGTADYVIAVTCQEEGRGLHLVVSVVPQHLDVWAWQKYYKESSQNHLVSVQRVDLEVLPTQSLPSKPLLREETDTGPGIFEHKELLIRGESVKTWQSNMTEHQVLAAIESPVACGLRIENWSKHYLRNREIEFKYGKESKKLPLQSVPPGFIELVVLEQQKAATGVSAVIRWNIESTSTILSLMISVPYNQHFWASWVAAGLTSSSAVPDFTAMYSGTPDSAWFVRQKMGNRIEFANGELILVVESDGDTSKPVVKLSVVPLNPDAVATSIMNRVEKRPLDRDGWEGDRSVLALTTSSCASSNIWVFQFLGCLQACLLILQF